MERRPAHPEEIQNDATGCGPLLPPRQVAALLGVEESTLAAWRKHGGGPPWYRIRSHLIRYDETEVLRWIHSQRSGQSGSNCAAQREVLAETGPCPGVASLLDPLDPKVRGAK